jgi:pyruvate,orthophosphate dikinase
VIEGSIPTRSSEIVQVLLEKKIQPKDSLIYQHFAKLLSWTDEIADIGVRTNADTPRDATVARLFGATGIGLCRTEHMFFQAERIAAVREMILADTLAERRRALAKILPMQREDFVGIFRAMDGYPVIIRTLDPPLHEFLPHTDQEIEELARQMGVSFEKLKERAESLKEANPMLGHRGCRLGISYPEITEMQARAILEAACQVAKEGVKVIPEVMIPLVGHINELRNQREIVDRVAKEVMAEAKIKVKYLVGTMIELPRAAITADQIAQSAQFFSYGTNDMTQRSRPGTTPASSFYRKTGSGRSSFHRAPGRRVSASAWRIKTNPKWKWHRGERRRSEFRQFTTRHGLRFCSPCRSVARLAAACRRRTRGKANERNSLP